MKVAIALGSNLGDRAGYLRKAVAALRALFAPGSFRVSSVYETDPVDCPPGSGPFYNAVATGDYAGSVQELLVALQKLESLEGRVDRAKNAPRPLDLDLLWAEGVRIETPGLTVPHPRAAERRFVLEPWSELDPDLRLPGQNRNLRALLDGVDAGEAVRRVDLTL